MDYEILIPKIKEYLTNLLPEQTPEYCFHNDHHTIDVVQATIEMAEHYALGAEDRFIVICAAYFHDIGYLSGGAARHEQRSAEVAEKFLNKNLVSQEVTQKVKSCILATKMPQTPRNLLEHLM